MVDKAALKAPWLGSMRAAVTFSLAMMIAAVRSGAQVGQPAAIDPNEYGLISPSPPPQSPRCHNVHVFSSDICVPDVSEPFSEFHRATAPEQVQQMQAPDAYPGLYKGVEVRTSGVPSFHYVRYDHMMSIPGGVMALRSYPMFGPFPANSTVRARKGAIYVFAWVCAPQVRSISLAIGDDPRGQSVNLACG